MTLPITVNKNMYAMSNLWKVVNKVIIRKVLSIVVVSFVLHLQPTEELGHVTMEHKWYKRISMRLAIPSL